VTNGKKIMMKIILPALVLIGAIPAHADPLRLNAMQHSCAELQSALDQNGEAIIRYPSERNPQITLYDRYVRRHGRCDVGKHPDGIHIPAADTRQCAVTRCIPNEDCEDGTAGCFLQ
jgi:hypothetical protein